MLKNRDQLSLRVAHILRMSYGSVETGGGMRIRGAKFKQWASSELTPFRHTAIIWGGVQVDVQVQLSEGVTLIFIGVYANNGEPIFEECYGTLHKDHPTAVNWALYMVEQAMKAHVNHVD